MPPPSSKQQQATRAAEQEQRRLVERRILLSAASVTQEMRDEYVKPRPPPYPVRVATAAEKKRAGTIISTHNARVQGLKGVTQEGVDVVYKEKVSAVAPSAGCSK